MQVVLSVFLCQTKWIVEFSTGFYHPLPKANATLVTGSPAAGGVMSGERDSPCHLASDSLLSSSTQGKFQFRSPAQPTP